MPTKLLIIKHLVFTINIEISRKVRQNDPYLFRIHYIIIWLKIMADEWNIKNVYQNKMGN